MNRSILETFFGHTEFFSHLNPEQMGKIANISHPKECVQGEILFYEGDDSRYFHLLVEGEIAVFKSSGTTQTVVIHRFAAPSLIAEVATLKQIPFPASAECTRDSKVIRIERDPLVELLKNDLSMSIAMIASLMDKIAALERSFKRHSAPNAQAKVALYILDEGSSFKHLKRIEIAAVLGITPETLSRTLKKFETTGMIRLSRGQGCVVLDSKKLRQVADNNFALRDSVLE